MTDRDYKRFGCTALGCEKASHTTELCQPHYQRMRKYGYTHPHVLVCKQCGKTFESDTKATIMYCSPICRGRYNHNSTPRDVQIEKNKQAREKYSIPCKCCFKMMGMKGLSVERRKTKEFCSNKCKFGYHQKIKKEIDGIKRISFNNSLYKVIGVKDAKKLIAAIVFYAKHKDYEQRKNRSCKDCGKEIKWSGIGMPIKYCVDCKKERDAYSLKSQRLKRKLLMKASKVGSVSIKQVFDRCGWKCQMCGVKTPKEKRGTYKKNAPELDHIVPLSKGGPHTMDNLQLLCRSCNAYKLDRLIPAQMGLFA